MEKNALIVSILSFIISLSIGLKTFLRDRVNSFNAHITEINKITIEYPELLYIYDKKKLDKIFNKKGVIFRNRMLAFIDLHFNIFENTYLQYLSSIFPFKRDKKTWDDFIKLIFKSNTVQNRWETWKKENVYDKKFMAYIEILRKNDKNESKNTKNLL